MRKMRTEHSDGRSPAGNNVVTYAIGRVRDAHIIR